MTLYKNVYEKGSFVYGTDIGLYSDIGKKFDTFFVKNDNIMDLKLYLSVQGYLLKGNFGILIFTGCRPGSLHSLEQCYKYMSRRVRWNTSYVIESDAISRCRF